MKIKNTGTTIISVGKNAILPDETVEVAATGYENNAALNFLVKSGNLSIVKEKAATEKKTAATTAAAKAKE